MAFYDDLARDPKSEKEFWAIIEETFVQVKGALTDYPVETREEALTARCAAANSRTHHFPSFAIVESRRPRQPRLFPRTGPAGPTGVEQQIKARKLTPKFAKDWGVVMMCHGFISAHILDDSDGLDRVRSGQSGNRNAQRKYVAHLMIREIDRGQKRADAEVAVAEKIKAVLRSPSFPSGFSEAWFSSMITRGGLASTYDQKHLSVRRMRQLVQQNLDDIPPIDFP